MSLLYKALQRAQRESSAIVSPGAAPPAPSRAHIYHGVQVAAAQAAANGPAAALFTPSPSIKAGRSRQPRPQASRPASAPAWAAAGSLAAPSLARHGAASRRPKPLIVAILQATLGLIALLVAVDVATAAASGKPSLTKAGWKALAQVWTKPPPAPALAAPALAAPALAGPAAAPQAAPSILAEREAEPAPTPIEAAPAVPDAAMASAPGQPLLSTGGEHPRQLVPDTVSQPLRGTLSALPQGAPEAPPPELLAALRAAAPAALDDGGGGLSTALTTGLTTLIDHDEQGRPVPILARPRPLLTPRIRVTTRTEASPPAADPVALTRAAEADAARGAFEPALRSARAAVAASPDDPVLAVNLAILLDRTQRAAEAVAAYRRAVVLARQAALPALPALEARLAWLQQAGGR